MTDKHPKRPRDPNQLAKSIETRMGSIGPTERGDVCFMQYVGLDRGHFDSDQLQHTLAQGKPFRPGRTIGSSAALN
jgi:hypothetical protein